MKIEFIVAGQPAVLDCHPDAEVWVYRYLALLETDNTGRPPADFDIYDNEGRRLDPTTLVKDIPAGNVWLSPAIGIGASHRNHRRKDFPPIMNPPGGNGGGSIVGRTGARNDYRAHARTWTADGRRLERAERRTARLAVLEPEFSQSLFAIRSLP